ncbi:MAG: methyltransferase domain-containing protein [Candidatus Calescibacterium sp.]|jgi:SAM-dependent methyltransferase
MKSREIICPLCLSENCKVEEYHGDYTIYQCNTCKLIFSHPMRSNFDYSSEKTHWRREVFRVADEIGKLLTLKEKVKVLEIGAGDLRHISYLKHRFGDKLEAYAYDLFYDHFIIKKANEGNIHLLHDLINNEKYDLIFLFHTLEHLENPREFITKIKEQLNDGGALIISVPNPRRITKIIFKKEAWDYPPYHLTRWDENSLTFLAKITGLFPYRILYEDFDFSLHYLVEVDVKYSIYQFLHKLKRIYMEKGINKDSKSIGFKKINTEKTKKLFGFLAHVSYFVLASVLTTFLVIFGKKRGLSLTLISYKPIQHDKKVIIFDFDGTIIKDDSFSLILNFMAKANFFKKIKLFLWSKMYGYRIIDNTKFKSITTGTILKGSSTDQLKHLCTKIAVDLINRNRINLQVLQDLIEYASSNNNSHIIILSATPVEVVSFIMHEIIKRLYPEFLTVFRDKIKFIGSTFKWNRNNKLEGLLENCYQGEKKDKLIRMGILECHTFYTDSLTDDQSIVEISANVFVVQSDKIYRLEK